MNMNFKRKLILCVLLVSAVTAFAFDAAGHRIVAEVAYDHLAKNTRQQVDKILGKRGLIYASTWADEVKSDDNYRYSYNWHFQDLDDSLSNEQIEHLYADKTAEGEHLFFAIDQMEKRLVKDKMDVEALKYLVHFIGDLHQPLHLGRKTDLGGNKVELRWFGKNIKLHALWDSYLIEEKQMSYKEYAEFLEDKFSGTSDEIAAMSLIQSIERTYEVRNLIYDYDYGDTNNFHYIYKMGGYLDEQLFRGGIMLAKILNDIYS